MPHGEGSVVFLAWDWFNAVPLGPTDGGWDDVLGRAIVECCTREKDIALFYNSTFVGVGASSVDEATNLKLALELKGHTVNTFTGITDVAWSSALDSADMLHIPELENGDLAAALSPNAIAVISNYVSEGGCLVTYGDSPGRSAALLNTVFGFATFGFGVNPQAATISSEAGFSSFAGGPTSLAGNSAHFIWQRSSLPAGALSIYEISGAAVTSVAVMSQGLGSVLFLAWDWFDAFPAGSQDGGWDDVLGRSVAQCCPVNCIIDDDFDAVIDPTMWDVILNGSAQSGAGFLDGNALWFNGTGDRSATTFPIDVRAGGEVTFDFRASDGAFPWELNDFGENTVLEYSINGVTYVELLLLTNSLIQDWISVDVTIPSAAQSCGTQFRWRQLSNSGGNFDNWAIDNVCINDVTTSSTTSSTSTTTTTTTSSSTSFAGEVNQTLIAARDNTMYARSNDFTNSKGKNLWTGLNAISRYKRSAVYFDVAGSVPSEATITSAILRLHVDRSRFQLPTTMVGIYKLLKDWGEGETDAANDPVCNPFCDEGGRGSLAQTGEMTRAQNFYAVSSWANLGGDFVASASDTRVVTSRSVQVIEPIASVDWSSTQTVADVQSWLDGPSSNFGWILIDDEVSTLASRRYISKDSTINTFGHPKLILGYVTLTSTTTSSTSTTSTSSTSTTSTTTSSTSTTLSPPLIVDVDTDVTLFAIYSPTGTVRPVYSTNLGIVPIEWLTIGTFTNTFVDVTNIIIEFDPPDTNAPSIFYHLLQTNN